MIEIIAFLFCKIGDGFVIDEIEYGIQKLVQHNSYEAE